MSAGFVDLSSKADVTTSILKQQLEEAEDLDVKINVRTRCFKCKFCAWQSNGSLPASNAWHRNTGVAATMHLIDDHPTRSMIVLKSAIQVGKR